MHIGDIEKVHDPVMVQECLNALEASKGGLFIDATLGLGGHSEAILKVSDATRVIGIDQDAEALKLASSRLGKFGNRFRSVHANFESVEAITGPEKIDGILADLGVSSMQLDSEKRGFSFRFDAPLDMRMDPHSGTATAADLLETLDRDELANIIYRFGEERHSRRIAKWIIERRESGQPVKSTFDLAELVKRAVPRNKADKIHPATRTFQALRITVNRELEIIDRFIEDSIKVLKTNGVLAMITFHSLEDRIVKLAFQRLSGKCMCPPKIPQCVCGALKKVDILTRKPIVPSGIEQSKNARSRSAKLRACRKIKC